MYDRALQALVKLGLEPEWEARFEPNSYGLFRRSAHDDIGAIFDCIKHQPKYVLHADISKCMSRCNNEQLLHRHCHDTRTDLEKKTYPQPKVTGFT